MGNVSRKMEIFGNGVMTTSLLEKSPELDLRIYRGEHKWNDDIHAIQVAYVYIDG